MPLLGAKLLTASIDATKKIVTVTGENFGEIQTDAFKIEVSVSGSGVWTEADSYSGYGNTGVTATFNTELAVGDYDVHGTSSDNTPMDALSAAFTVAASGVYSLQEVGQEVGQNIMNH